MPREGGFPGYRIFWMLALLALAVGVGAYPLARRLTRRLERLQAGSIARRGAISRSREDEGRDEGRLAESFNRAAAASKIWSARTSAARQRLARAAHASRPYPHGGGTDQGERRPGAQSRPRAGNRGARRADRRDLLAAASTRSKS